MDSRFRGNDIFNVCPFIDQVPRDEINIDNKAVARINEEIHLLTPMTHKDLGTLVLAAIN